MATQIKIWGNCQEIRSNNFLGIEVEDEKIMLTKTFEHKTLEERVVESSGSLGPYKEFEW